jgi:hypothetical protein
MATIAAGVVIITFALFSFNKPPKAPDTPYVGFFATHKDNFMALRDMMLSERKDLMSLSLTPENQLGNELYYCNSSNDCHQFYKSSDGYWSNGNKWKHDDSKYSEQEVLDKVGLSSQRYNIYRKLVQSIEGGQWPVSLFSVSLNRQDNGEEKVCFNYSYAEIISTSKKPPAPGSDDQDDFYKLATGWFIYYTGGE